MPWFPARSRIRIWQHLPRCRRRARSTSSGRAPRGHGLAYEDELTYYDQIWHFITPQNGMRIWVRDEGQYYEFESVVWVLASVGGGSDTITPTSVTTTGTIKAANYYLGAQGNFDFDQPCDQFSFLCMADDLSMALAAAIGAVLIEMMSILSSYFHK